VVRLLMEEVLVDNMNESLMVQHVIPLDNSFPNRPSRGLHSRAPLRRTLSYLRRLSSTSQSCTVPLYASLQATPAGCSSALGGTSVASEGSLPAAACGRGGGAKKGFILPIHRSRSGRCDTTAWGGIHGTDPKRSVHRCALAGPVSPPGRVCRPL